MSKYCIRCEAYWVSPTVHRPLRFPAHGIDEKNADLKKSEAHELRNEKDPTLREPGGSGADRGGDHVQATARPPTLGTRGEGGEIRRQLQTSLRGTPR
mmetsp:Transcript_40108/g.94239  ORF Transcript_40108/g.94239 Transcript_40108/m.94239 type:complete len:98 (-) Transcript_40108:125-418(-)